MAKIVSIHSFRGGTGKSNLTANLASLVALEGKRVAVVDTDIQSPGIHMPFALAEDRVEFALNHFIWGECEIEKAAYDVSNVLPRPGGPLHLVPSSMKIADIGRILKEGYDVRLLNDGFQALIEKLHLDYLFVDTHPGVNEETLLSIAISDTLVLILRPDQQDFQGTAVTVELARKLDVPNMMLVINKALPSMNFADLRAKAEAIYRVPVAAVLPLTPELVQLASSGLLSILYPDLEASREMKKVADHILAG
ncbi:MAG TPA: MinD/ParA family protein [Candidatus Methylacidiphilales bacterium]|jgi:MinD-like ATPase involved in chromosome partitioning or flagellar assembly|nr:MinD/ParA family protein [Candidatus Methylacidiphilales bacterium]